VVDVFGRWRAGGKGLGSDDGKGLGSDDGAPLDKRILAILDHAAAEFSFPMLDNGYIYPAATRLSLHRSETDWALVIEVFGFSPRTGLPDVGVSTFASRIHGRKTAGDFVNERAFQNYLALHPHDEATFFFPIDEGDWQRDDDIEAVDTAATNVVVRGTAIPLPDADVYAAHRIDLADPPGVRVFELCRYLAAIARDEVLATTGERRTNVLPEMTEILVLDEWNHPDLVHAERPSGSEAFQQLATVLATGDVGAYRPTLAPNTHWANWPDGGAL
jgi:hypothetical protein